MELPSGRAEPRVIAAALVLAAGGCSEIKYQIRAAGLIDRIDPAGGGTMRELMKH